MMEKMYHVLQIWNTVKRAGKRAASFYWPGAEGYIHGE